MRQASRLAMMCLAVLMFAGQVKAGPFFMGLGGLGRVVLSGQRAGFRSRADGISADGSVVVGEGFSASGLEAFRWTSGSGMVGLGDFPGGGFRSFASAVSADGSVVVGEGRAASGIGEAFRTTSGGGVGLGGLGRVLNLGSAGFAGFRSRASGVSADGSVVVGEGFSASGFEAFRWTSGSGMVGLGDLPGGGFQSIANGVSADGSVVVGRGSSASGGEAFRWTAGSGMVGLGDLPGGIFNSNALGISADGSVIVGQGFSASGGEAFRWTAGGGMVGLGDLPGGFNGRANAVSADGSVVVGESDIRGGFFSRVTLKKAFLWDAANGMRSLQTVLTNDFGLGSSLAGWTLTSARGISGDGLRIVGFGTNPSGQREAFVASLQPAAAAAPAAVPEPSSFVLLGIGAVCLIGYRRKRLRTIVVSNN